MSHPRRAVLPSRPERNLPTIPAKRSVGTPEAATIVPNRVVTASVLQKPPRRAGHGYRSGTSLGVLTVGPSRPVTGTIVPTAIPTPAVLRNPTVVTPAPIAASRPAIAAPRRPAVFASPVKPNRRPIRAPLIPGAPLAQGPWGPGGPYRRVLVRRR